MKEHTQTMGIRKWAGDDLIELQKEPLDALQALVEPYAPCIIQGCVPTPNENGKTYTVSPGFVALKGKIVRFEGKNNAMLPLYLGLECKTENRAYADGGNKPIKYQYVTKEVDKDTADDSCLTITADDSANPHLVDTMGITQKLDREGGNASDVKVGFGEENTEELKSGNTLAKLFGAIKKWLSDIKKKLDGIEDGANKYIHPTSAAGAKSSGFYKITTDANGHITAVTSVTKADITGLGIPAQDTKYTHPSSAAGAKSSGFYKITTDANGHITAVTDVTKSDITGLGIPAQDTVYTHPTTAGNKHIPNGGSSGQYLKYSAAGTAQWASPASNLATTSAAGFMSADDKKKLTYFQIMGIYFLGESTILYGFKSVALSCRQDTHNGRKCLYVKMPAETGSYMILQLVSNNLYSLATYGSRWSAGEEAIVYHLDPNGNAGYFDYAVGFMLVKTTITLTA